MKFYVGKTKEIMGLGSAKQAAKIINDAIARQGYARILLSTGASQFPFFEEFIKQDIDWERVEAFHLDEYVGISEEHPASFKRYLIDRFASRVPLKEFHLINGLTPPEETIAELTALIKEKPIDLGLIGIGENGHIAFNDPPADFNDKASYKVVTLDDRCLMQQVGEGWFKAKEEAYKQAISMTCPEIMRCKAIISVVPYPVKAEAVYKTLTEELTPYVPATLLKTHPDFTLWCDSDSASMLSEELLAKYGAELIG